MKKSRASRTQLTTHPSQTSTSKSLSSLKLQNAGVVYALILIILIFTISTYYTGRPIYLSATNIANVFDQTSLMGILAVFMTIVLISGNFDLSIGATGALAAGITLTLLNHTNLAIALVGGLLCGLGVGLLNGILVQIVGVNAFIVTLGTMTAIRGALLVLTHGQSIATSHDSLSQLVNGEVALNAKWLSFAIAVVLMVFDASTSQVRGRRYIPRVPGGLVFTIGLILACVSLAFFPTYWAVTRETCVFLVLVAVASLILRYTVVGRRLYAVGGNAEAARLAGINVARYKIVPFVLTGLASALVGIIYAGRFSAINPDALTGTELTVLAAAILGGTSLFGGAGSVLKSMVGALILFVLANGFAVLNLGPNYQSLIQGGVIIVAASVYVLAGRRGRRVVPPISRSESIAPTSATTRDIDDHREVRSDAVVGNPQ